MLKSTRHGMSTAILVAIYMVPISLLAQNTAAQVVATKMVDRASLPTINAHTLATDYAAERAHRPPGHKQPTIGLALSGGGTKAAMFSHGVLHGLHDAGVLERVDAISSVSGGGYAAFWYLSKYLESTRSPTFKVSQIFDDCLPSYWTQYGSDKHMKAMMLAAIERPPKAGMPECENAAHFRAKNTSGTEDPYRWQAHVMRWPDVLQVRPVHLDGGVQGSPEWVIKAGVARALSVEVLRNFIGKESAVPRLYQYGIERTWGLNPLPRSAKLAAANRIIDERKIWNYTNGDRADADMGSKVIPRVDPRTMQWLQLRSLYDSEYAWAPPPLWIVNSTDGDKKTSSATYIDNTTKIFEITPFGFGSANPNHIHKGYLNHTPVVPQLIADLGLSVRASGAFADAQGIGNGVARKLVGLIARFIPGARWGVEIVVPPVQGEKIHLSDGGGSENLGLYSLLKRGVDDIIVVDTASDPEGNMSDLCEVLNALKKEHFTVEFPALENLDGVCELQPARSVRIAYNVSAWKNRVVKGTVTWPTKDDQPTRASRIWLIKAAWDERAVAAAYTRPQKCGNEVRQINCLLAVFYGHNRGIQNKKDEYMLFPQLSTVATTANSSSYLFWGYRELGRMLGTNLQVNGATGRLELRDERQCKQVAHRRRKGRRPENIKFIPPSPCEEISENLVERKSLRVSNG